jgi:hypothetical protein
MTHKGGKRRLRAVPARIFPDHRGTDAVVHRRFYAALAEDLPLPTPLLRSEGSRVALLHVLAVNAARALVVAQAASTRGRGRRPSPQAIERLARRAGLADGSYSVALDKLRALALAQPRVPATPEELMAALVDHEQS